ncbi:MAG: hypothetical protein Q9196_005539 [Gyalolechia fulgens]
MYVDVLICGAGPVGLIFAYQLKRMGITVYLAEKARETDRVNYGGAGAISPRTMELLDQLGLADRFIQHGFVCKSSSIFRGGQRVSECGWEYASEIGDTAFDFVLNLRQMHTERMFRTALEAVGQQVHEGSRLVDFSVTDPVDKNGSLYTVILENWDGSTTLVNARYIVGADGGSSTVRKLAGIKFLGDSTPMEWVRLDAVVTTNMPDSRAGPVSILSSNLGNVLWTPMDHGRTRIAFRCTPQLRQRHHRGVGLAEIKFEAIQALKPFDLTIRSVDWWAIDSVGHRLAEHYFASPSTTPRSAPSYDVLTADKKTSGIFIAGDAAHTYSSGTALGMDVGIQDATNLSWKLAGVIKGWFDYKILVTYESERRPAAVKVIKLDESMTSVLSGEVPKAYPGTQTDPTQIFLEVLNGYAQATVGLHHRYEVDGLLNQINDETCEIMPGQRAPDVSVCKPGTLDRVRLYTIMQNTGKFWIVTFVRPPPSVMERYTHYLAEFHERWGAFCDYATIITGQASSVGDALAGHEPLGKAYFDVDKRSAFERYGIDPQAGGIVVVRPDGVVGFACLLDRFHELERYFAAFCSSTAKRGLKRSPEDHQTLWSNLYIS